MMNSNRFSLRRVGMLAGFYSPGIKKMFLVSGIVLLVCYFISFYGASMARAYPDKEVFVLIYSMGAGIVGWVYLVGPLVFAMPAKRELATTLPASWAEKSVFVLGWIFVAYPLFLAALWYGVSALCSLFSDSAWVNSVMLDHINTDSPVDLNRVWGGSMYLNRMQDMAVVSVVALVVCSVRRNRLAYGVVGMLVALFAFWVLGVVIGVVAAIKSRIFQDVADHSANPDSIAASIVTEIAELFPWVIVVAAIIVCVCSLLIIRKIRTREG